jgi:hypothetical protein
MDTVVKSSNQAFLSDASWLPEWAATVMFIAHVGIKFVTMKQFIHNTLYNLHVSAV